MLTPADFVNCKFIQNKNNGVTLTLTIQANAHKSEIVGLYNDTLKIKIKAPPVDGKANKEIISFLSEKLGITQKNIEILKGDKNKNKIVLLMGESLQSLSIKLCHT